MLDTSEIAIASRLREAMRAEGLTNTQLAERCEVSVQAVGDWLRSGNIGRWQIAVICKAINRTSDWLLTGEPRIDDALNALPEDARRDVVEYLLYKIEKTSPPYVSDAQAHSYADMVESLKHDLAARRAKNGARPAKSERDE